MNLALNRKRSRLDLDDNEDHPSAPTTPAFTDSLKRSKTQSELDDLDIATPEDAWRVDVSSILSSPTLASAPDGSLQTHHTLSNYVVGSSIVVFCVQGNLQLHYDLLCSTLPDLCALSPSLQALVLCRDPSSHIPSTSTPLSLPLVQAVGPDYNHFVRLGLLHPLGGGNLPLDALVVLDTQGRRRLVLPFGWGAGRHASTPAGKTVQDRLMGLLRTCIEGLVKE
ncbi:hypothetical protein K505DRAFT_343622 [Melanomma pulvis-pyrius CBS 109.77]|uniref:Uncharacterized protein n=1 Tax=Melanomma pulvis-pyrius CBS 109.77 TaxID=1314802 RepID=A0A6A6WRV1_9PLEO|nr:hypothetical protein K505DRAFT_343622 [Melanomma pulvis-pyrius CBS 109.77]